MRKILLLLIVPLLMISACGKDEDPKPDTVNNSLAGDTVAKLKMYGSPFNTTVRLRFKQGSTLIKEITYTFDFEGGGTFADPKEIYFSIKGCPASGTYTMEMSTYNNDYVMGENIGADECVGITEAVTFTEFRDGRLLETEFCTSSFDL